jgi:protocatechuate 3,4-dioxygenase, alpha subunit
MTDSTALPTPSQTSGPFLSIGLLDGYFGPALVVEDDPRAIRIRGRLLDGNGDPVPDGLVEIWQADSAGRYAHPDDAGHGAPPEAGFLGFGRSGTADDGWFEFVTVKPGRLRALEGGLQAPHVVVTVFARGLLKHVVTRLYFPDEVEANAEDPVLLGLEPPERETLVAQTVDGHLRFDIVLQGDRQTTFFAV